MRAAYNGSSSAAYFVPAPGAFHSNFMDVPLWSPLAPMLGIAGPIDGRRAHDIINAYSLAFFNRHLEGRAQALLDGPMRGLIRTFSGQTRHTRQRIDNL